MMRGGLVQRLRDRIECRRLRPLLQPFVDGALDSAQQRQVVRHLDACRRCGLETATYAALINRLHGIDRSSDADAIARLQAFVDELAADDDRPG
ncbi:zf-HC2 domain-containing protein [soil metagenome]